MSNICEVCCKYTLYIENWEILNPHTDKIELVGLCYSCYMCYTLNIALTKECK